MKGNIEERACELAAYIIENRTTVREAARRFGISKSTVHMDRGKWNGGAGVIAPGPAPFVSQTPQYVNMSSYPTSVT